MPLNDFAEVTPILAAQVWLTADGTAFKTILAAQPTICRIDTLVALNDDAVNHDVTLTLVDPASAIHGIGTVRVPAHAGSAGVPDVDLLSTLFPATQVGMALPTGWALEAHMDTATTNAVGIVAFGGYF